MTINTQLPLTYLVRREHFSAAHRLHSVHLSDEENARVFGKCNWENGHGHNYEIEVTVRGPIDPDTGMMMNLVDLKSLIEDHILDKVDHRHLNHDVEEFKTINPTAENIAVVFWDWLKPHLGDSLYEMKVYETPRNIAVYRGEQG